MDLQLIDKTALVTGSTAGIGLEIARKLAVEGAKVIVTGRNQAKLDQAVETIRASGGANVRGILADASTAEGATALLNAAPRLDILVNNLGIYETKNFAEITDEAGGVISTSMSSAASDWLANIFRACWSETGAGSSSFPASPRF